jgi:hypothetical protein
MLALKHGWDAVSADPTDPRLRNNVTLMRNLTRDQYGV